MCWLTFQGIGDVVGGWRGFYTDRPAPLQQGGFFCRQLSAEHGSQLLLGQRTQNRDLSLLLLSPIPVGWNETRGHIPCIARALQTVSLQDQPLLPLDIDMALLAPIVYFKA